MTFEYQIITPDNETFTAGDTDTYYRLLQELRSLRGEQIELCIRAVPKIRAENRRKNHSNAADYGLL
jgi:hypothetical protein